MYSRSWQIIRDDGKKTFEVNGQESNNDHFLNLVHGMQKAGMTVTAVTLPVTNQHASKESIRVAGYKMEAGLFDRLVSDYRLRISGGLWEDV